MREDTHYALITPGNLDSAWPIAAPWLMQAIGEADTWRDVDHLRQEILRGNAHLWMFQDKKTKDVLVVIVTEAIMLGGKPCLVIRWLGGADMQKWLDDIAIIERWAAVQGFHKVEVWGRPGWQRMLKPYGFRETFRVLEKTVDRGVH